MLRAQGLAYVRFALKTPELYRIATMGEGRPGSDVDMTLNSSAFVHMRNSVEALMAEGILPGDDSTSVALELWTAAHGVAAMLISRPYLPWGDAEEFADRVLRAVVLRGDRVRRDRTRRPPRRTTVARLKGLLDEQHRR